MITNVRSILLQINQCYPLVVISDD